VFFESAFSMKFCMGELSLTPKTFFIVLFALLGSLSKNRFMANRGTEQLRYLLLVYVGIPLNKGG
jgi:hypothetical protein